MANYACWGSCGGVPFVLVPPEFPFGNEAIWFEAHPDYCFSDSGGTISCGDGDPIYVWKDRSGNNLSFEQSTESSRPVLREFCGTWYVYFDGTDDSMTTSNISSVSRPYSWFLVERTVTNQSTSRALTSTDTNSLISLSRSGSNSFFATNNLSDSYASTAGTHTGAVVAAAGVPAKVRLDNVNVATGYEAGDWGTVTIGGPNSIFYEPVNTYIRHIVGYNRTLSGAELNALQTALAYEGGCAGLAMCDCNVVMDMATYTNDGPDIAVSPALATTEDWCASVYQTLTDDSQYNVGNFGVYFGDSDRITLRYDTGATTWRLETQSGVLNDGGSGLMPVVGRLYILQISYDADTDTIYGRVYDVENDTLVVEISATSPYSGIDVSAGLTKVVPNTNSVDNCSEGSSTNICVSGPAPSAGLMEGLVSYWPLDEASGTRYDYFGPNHFTTATGTLGAAEGKISGSLSCTDGYLYCDDNDTLDTNEFSVSCWINIDGSSSNYRYVIVRQAASDWSNPYGTWAIRISSSGSVEGWVGTGLTYDTYVQQGGSLSTDEWHFVAMTYDGATLKLYIDNTLEDTLSYSAGDLTSGYGILVGNRVGGTEAFVGMIDEIGLWNRALTADEVADLWNGGAGYKVFQVPVGQLALWVDASELTAGSLATWEDRGPEGNDVAQGSSGNQPTVIEDVVNGLSVVRFDGTDDVMSVSASTGADLTLIAVASLKRTPPYNFADMLASTSDDNCWFLANAGASTSETFAAGGDGTTGFTDIRVNGVLNGSLGNFPASGFSVLSMKGTVAAGGSTINLGYRQPIYYGQVDIAELLIYDGILPDSTIAVIEGYLTSKWLSEPCSSCNLLSDFTVYTDDVHAYTVDVDHENNDWCFECTFNHSSSGSGLMCLMVVTWGSGPFKVESYYDSSANELAIIYNDGSPNFIDTSTPDNSLTTSEDYRVRLNHVANTNIITYTITRIGDDVVMGSASGTLPDSFMEGEIIGSFAANSDGEFGREAGSFKDVCISGTEVVVSSATCGTCNLVNEDTVYTDEQHDYTVDFPNTADWCVSLEYTYDDGNSLSYAHYLSVNFDNSTEIFGNQEADGTVTIVTYNGSYNTVTTDTAVQPTLGDTYQVYVKYDQSADTIYYGSYNITEDELVFEISYVGASAIGSTSNVTYIRASTIYNPELSSQRAGTFTNFCASNGTVTGGGGGGSEDSCGTCTNLDDATVYTDQGNTYSVTAFDSTASDWCVSVDYTYTGDGSAYTYGYMRLWLGFSPSIIGMFDAMTPSVGMTYENAGYSGLGSSTATEVMAIGTQYRCMLSYKLATNEITYTVLKTSDSTVIGTHTATMPAISDGDTTQLYVTTDFAMDNSAPGSFTNACVSVG